MYRRVIIHEPYTWSTGESWLTAMPQFLQSRLDHDISSKLNTCLIWQESSAPLIWNQQRGYVCVVHVYM